MFAMKRQKNIPSRPSVVGIVDSPTALSAARRLKKGAVDFLEWRADAWGNSNIPVLPGRRWILTARDPQEGGIGSLEPGARKLLLAAGLEHCHLVDIEVRNLQRFSEVVAGAHSLGRAVIGSFHDFRGVPSPRRLADVVARAEEGGADMIKLAMTPREPAQVARLLEAFALSPLPVAVMGMGPYGLSARLLCAQCGSVLNYGWMAAPNVPGQWAASELSELFFRMSLR